MTWDELVEKAEEMGAKIVDDNPYRQEKIMFETVSFYKNGRMIMEECLVADRTPEQMLMIMRGLE